MPKSLFARYSTSILILVCVILGSAGFAFVLRPSLEGFRLAREQLAEAELAAKNVQDALGQVRALSTQAALGSPAEIEKLYGMFIASPELAYLLTSIAKHAEATRWLMTSIALGSSSQNRVSAVSGPLTPVPVQMQLKGGGYGELKGFLKLITTSVPIYEVSSFTFDPESTTLSLNLNVFTFKEDAGRPVALDAKFFEDPRFKALRAPVPLPVKEPIGKANPFAAPAQVVAQ